LSADGTTLKDAVFSESCPSQKELSYCQLPAAQNLETNVDRFKEVDVIRFFGEIFDNKGNIFC
jgi:hypothetical protein